MKAFLDACVLYPTVMRETLLGAAKQGFFAPQWSDRVLEEWARAAEKHGAGDHVFARSEAALLNAAFPRACARSAPELEARLWLPDTGDLHVLASAIAGSSDAIVTVNAKDFPRHILAEEGLSRADPDAFLLGFFEADPEQMWAVTEAVHSQAERLSGAPWSRRALFKKARLPRLAKAVEAYAART